MTTQIIFTNYDKELITKNYLDSGKITQLATEFGVCRNTLTKYLKMWGVWERRLTDCTTVDINKDKIIYLYDSGMSAEEIATIFGCTNTTILNRLRLWEASVRSHPLVNFTVFQKGDIIDRYVKGATVTELSNMYNTSPNTIIRRLVEWEVYNPKVYYVNDNYFSNMDTSNKACILGFITADGCITKNSLVIHLKIDDTNHLQKILNEMGANHILHIREKSVQLQITNNVIIGDLRKHGITERKSLTVKPSNLIPCHLKRDYYRGLVDGDGSVGICRIGKYYSPYISLVGTYAICTGFMEYCKTLMDSPAKVNKQTGGKIYVYKVCGRNAVPIIRDIYGDAELYLDRKYKRAMKALDFYG